MNHNYRIIWSDFANGYVVVSEATKSKGKSSKSVKLAVGAATAAIISSAPVAMADDINQANQFTSLYSSSTFQSSAFVDMTSAFNHYIHSTGVVSNLNVGWNALQVRQREYFDGTDGDPDLDDWRWLAHTSSFANNGGLITSSVTSSLGLGYTSSIGIFSESSFAIGETRFQEGGIGPFYQGFVNTTGGRITAHIDGDTTNDVYAAAIDVGAQTIVDANRYDTNNGSNMGQIFNDGLIQAYATGIEFNDATAVGINVRGSIVDGQWTNGGNITNDHNGTISAQARSYTSNAFATAIAIGDNIDGNFTNNGIIAATAIANDDAYATGVFVDDNITGNFTNSGNITATALADSDAYGYGVYVGNNTSTFTNSGNITASATSYSSSAVAQAIRVEGSVNGNFTNSGVITATALADSEAEAYGVWVDNYIAGNFLNNGNITASATSGYYSAEAQGIRVYDSGIYSSAGSIYGNFTNNGHITATAISYAENSYSSEAEAYGVRVQSDIGGTFANTGHITATATSYGSFAEAYGVYVGNNIDGNFSNSGNITATANSYSPDDLPVLSFHNYYSSANAYGVYVGNNIGGDFSNTGNITATAIADNNSAYNSNAMAYGVHVGQNILGNFTNSGNITATATSDYDSAEAYGVHVGQNILGNFTNSGHITATATATYSSSKAYGVYVGQNIAGDFTNSGNITATATSTYDGTAEAFGVHVGQNIAGDFTNSGHITATATGDIYADAYGVHVDENILGNFTNSGNISAIATGDESSAYAYGVYVGQNIAGDFTNSGHITATASANTSYAYAYGVHVGQNILGNFTNSGHITATATSTDSSADAYGVSVGNNIAGDFTNSGNITATATGDSYADAYGVYVGQNILGNFTNTGHITATATSTYSSAEAFGVYVGNNIAGDFTNNGNIIASAISGNFAGAIFNGDDVGAYGVFVNNNIEGNFTNNGNITATAFMKSDDEEEAYGYGVLVGENILGDFTNNGNISTSVTIVSNEDEDAYGFGVYVGNNIAGDFTNSGNITTRVNIYDDDDDAYGYGVYVGENIEGDFINSLSGNISVFVSASSNSDNTDDVEANAVRVFGSVLGNFTNAGVIGATAFSTDEEADAYGVYVDENIAGDFTNSGNITVSATSTYDSAEAQGIRVGDSGFYSSAGSIYGNFTNSGFITVGAFAGSSEAQAYGIRVDNSIEGDFTNTGNISATAVSETDYADSYGVYVENNITGDFLNNGNITATATPGSNDVARAYGVYLGAIEGNFTNNGLIMGKGDDHYGYSVVIENDAGGSFTNNYVGNLQGAIDVAADVTNSGMLNSRLTNSSVSGDYTQNAGGTYKFSLENEVISGNSTNVIGALSVDGDLTLADNSIIRVNVLNPNSDSDEIYDAVFTQGTTTVANEPGRVESVMNSTGGALNVNNNGSRIKVYDDSFGLNFRATDLTTLANTLDLQMHETGITTLSNAIHTTGISSASNLASILDVRLPQYAIDAADYGNVEYKQGLNPVFDQIYLGSSKEDATQRVASLLPSQGGMASIIAMTTLHAIQKDIEARQDLNVTGKSSGDTFYGDKSAWFKPFGSYTTQSTTGGVYGYDAHTFGATFGADTSISENNRVGAAFTFARTKINGDTNQDSTINTYVGHLYGSSNINENTYINYRIGGGVGDTDSNRQIAMLGESARSSYDNWNANAGISLAHSIKVSDSVLFTPSARLDYARVRTEGYVENGSIARLTVDGNTAEELIVGLDGKLRYSVSADTAILVNAGVGFDTINDQTSINSIFQVDPTLAFNTTGIDRSPWLGRGGVGLASRIVGGGELSARYDLEGREHRYDHVASMRIKWDF